MKKRSKYLHFIIYFISFLYNFNHRDFIFYFSFIRFIINYEIEDVWLELYMFPGHNLHFTTFKTLKINEIILFEIKHSFNLNIFLFGVLKY